MGRDDPLSGRLESQTDHLNMNVDEWNRLIDGFDVEALADQLHRPGRPGIRSPWARIPVIICHQTRLMNASPASRVSARAGTWCRISTNALHKRGIRLAVYLPSGAPNKDEKAVVASPMAKRSFPKSRVPDEMGASDP